MKKKEISSKDLLLCFLYSPGINNISNEPIIGRTKLTKMMFLFEKEVSSSFFNDRVPIDLPKFEPYFFGPFSKQLFEDLAFFESIGMIVSETTNIPLSFADRIEKRSVFDEEDDIWNEANFDNEDDELFESSYRLSDSGKLYIEDNVWNFFTRTQKTILQNFKSQINKISLDSLLQYVYTKYPEEAKKSIIADKYLKRAEE